MESDLMRGSQNSLVLLKRSAWTGVFPSVMAVPPTHPARRIVAARESGCPSVGPDQIASSAAWRLEKDTRLLGVAPPGEFCGGRLATAATGKTGISRSEVMAIVQDTEALTTSAPKRRLTMSRRETAWGLLFLSPWFIGLALFYAVPIIISFAMSFTDFNPVHAGD